MGTSTVRGERDYLIDDIRAAVEQVLSDRTPVASHGASLAQHELTCSRAAELTRRMEKMESLQIQHEKMLAEFVGAQKLQRWLIPTLVGGLGSSVTAALLMWLLKGN